MTDPFEVQSSERGVVRVFTTDLDAEGSSAITPENVQKLLGEGLELEPSRIEVFPSTVLEAMGLSAYLQEGYGILEEDLSGQAASLDAVKGLIVLVASSAFRGESATLDLKPGIRFVGAFREPSAAPPEQTASLDSAKGRLSSGSVTEPLNTKSRATWPLMLLSLVVAAALVLFIGL